MAMVTLLKSNSEKENRLTDKIKCLEEMVKRKEKELNKLRSLNVDNAVKLKRTRHLNFKENKQKN